MPGIDSLSEGTFVTNLEQLFWIYIIKDTSKDTSKEI